MVDADSLDGSPLQQKHDFAMIDESLVPLRYSATDNKKVYQESSLIDEFNPVKTTP